GKGIGARHAKAFVTDPRRCGRNRAGKHVEAAPDDRKKPLAGTGQFKRTGPAAKQRLTADLLQDPYLVADRGRCHAEFVCRLAEAHMPCGGLKGAKGSQWRQLSHAASVGEFNSSGY